ncbi:MAG: hypothetical protein RIM84_22220 [Alphaproteobacteria bacterium]
MVATPKLSASILAILFATGMSVSIAQAQSSDHGHGSAAQQGGTTAMSPGDRPGHGAAAGPGKMMGPGMMQQGDMMSMMHGQKHMPMMARMHRDSDTAMRVVPIQHLTKEDVTHYFDHWLARQGNNRLKVGTVNQIDDDTFTADIVTVDDSLVQRFRVDRHSGEVTKDNG